MGEIFSQQDASAAFGVTILAPDRSLAFSLPHLIQENIPARS